MNRFKFVLFCFLFLPFSVFADCSSSSLSRYKSLASHISNYYDYNGSSFDITLYNVSNQLKVVDGSNVYYSNSNFGDIVLRNISPGSLVKLHVYPIDSSCSNYRAYTIYVNLPYFNKYYSDPVCSNSGNALCSKWINTNIYTHDQFVEAVKKSSKVPTTEVVDPGVADRRYGFFDFLGDYYIYILLFIIVSGSLGIYYLDKKSKFDF